VALLNCHTCKTPVCISQINLFRRLSTDQQNHIVRQVIRRRFKKGEILIHEGDEMHQFFIVSQGSFKCYTSHQDGKQKTLYYFHMGDFFGQQTLFQKGASPYTVEAIQEASICMIESSTINQLIRTQPEFAFSIISELSDRVHSLELELSNVSIDPLETRLLRLLQELAKDFGYKQDHGCIMKLPLTQEEMGMRLGVSRESVSRSLKELQNKNKIAIQSNKRIIMY